MKHRRNNLILSFALVLMLFFSFLPLTASADWCDYASWYRKQITIDSGQVSSNLTNFPVYINITDSDLASDAQSDGDDILFTDESGVQLNHEIEYWDNTTGELIAWVNVTSLCSSSDTIIYMYYGNDACANQENPSQVFDFDSPDLSSGEHTIDGSFDAARSVYATDVDGDGDIDVLGAAFGADDITWWENDGSESFTEHTIDGSFDGARSVYACDVDSDGDIDVLGAASNAEDITWWENDGSESFTEHTIDGSFDGTRSVYACDVDSDGDIDVLGSAYNDGIAWWENDGSESFTEHTIDGSFPGACSVYAMDVDGDSDIDVLGAANGYHAHDINLYKNSGSESFTEYTIDSSSAYSVYACDVDGDSDIDVLGVLYDEIDWWENDGSESFTKHTIGDSLGNAYSVYACDIDSDDDIDVLGTVWNDNDIIWWENNGSESFTEHTIDGSFDGAASVYACDVDSDGDMDVLGAANGADDITWWESSAAPSDADWQMTYYNNQNNCSDGGFFSMGTEESVFWVVNATDGYAVAHSSGTIDDFITISGPDIENVSFSEDNASWGEPVDWTDCLFDYTFDCGEIGERTIYANITLDDGSHIYLNETVIFTFNISSCSNWDWDFNGDWYVNDSDIDNLTDHYLESGPPGWIAQDCDGGEPYDGDGLINYLDLSSFIGNAPFGMTPYGRFVINDDANETTSPYLYFNMSTCWADYMVFSETEGVFDSDHEVAYNDSYAYWSLSCGLNGEVTIYARFRDSASCYYLYLNDTIDYNCSAPDELEMSYPEENETYTDIEWGEDHILILEGIIDEDTDIAINVTSEDFYTYTEENIDFDYDFDDFYVSIDLSEYVWFDDQNYSITLNVSNCCGYALYYVNFTIGDPLTDLARHISLKALSPERENYTQVDHLEDEVSFDIICTDLSGITFFFFQTDWEGNILNEMTDRVYLDVVDGWQSFEYYRERFYSRSFYKSWIGIVNSTSDVQFDDLYGYSSIQYNSYTEIDLFHYTFNASELGEYSYGRYQIQQGDFIGDDNVTTYTSYRGLVWGYGTFFPGDEIPFHSIGNTLFDRRDIYDDDWAERFDDVFPGMGLLAGMMVIMVFSIIPIVATRTFPPLAIQLFFTEMGMVVAYAMGTFPLWVFELILIILLLAIAYTVLQWYRNRTGIQSFADTPMVTGTVKNIKTGVKYGKKAWKKRRPLVSNRSSGRRPDEEV